MSVQINKYHGNYNISTRKGKPEYIVCHYVGSGSSSPGNAKNNCIYFSGGNRNASANYFIDDGGIWEYADPDQYYTWHCGDGGGKYGITNANSIGIEVCINGDAPYTYDEINYLRELVVHLMSKYGIPANKVVRHYDASRKQCPLYYAKRDNEWYKLRNKITNGSSGGRWKKNDTGWWYEESDGSYPTNGWREIGGHWYYFDVRGYAQTGWILDDGKWYYLNPRTDIDVPECAMMTGWVFDNGYNKWYYFRPYNDGVGPKGSMLSGTWIKDDGFWFYLKEDGAMACNEVMRIAGKKYAFDEHGHMYDGVTPEGELLVNGH